MKALKQQLIYHYTNLTAALGILESQSLWATHYRYLNDTGELEVFRRALACWRKAMVVQRQPVDRLLRELLNSLLGETRQPQETEAYVISFCRDGGDRLSQWRAYGKGAGCALGFDKRELENLIKKEHERYYFDSSYIGRIYYGNIDRLPRRISDNLIECIAILEDRLAGQEHDFHRAVNLFIKGISSFKHEGFSEEKEYRLTTFVPTSQRDNPEDHIGRLPKPIKFRVVDDIIIPYIELFGEGYHLPIKKIIVGPPPRESAHHYRALQTILKEKGIDPEIVIPSNIPYRGK
jgi:hypothetical protein